MPFNEIIKQRPFLLVLIPIVILGGLFLMITPQNFQLMTLAIVNLIFIIAVIFSGVITYQIYKKYHRPYDLLIIPAFVGIFFICLTVILISLIFILDPIIFKKLMENLSIISFPLALFGVGISLYYFIESQMSTDNKLDAILLEFKRIPSSNNNHPPPETQIAESSVHALQPDDETTLSEEDKIIIQHLFERHRTSLSSGDAIDMKLAQTIALTGVILSFILIKSPEIHYLSIYITGIFFLIGSIFIGILAFRSTEWCAGANARFFKDCGEKISSKDGVRRIKDMLADDIQDNKVILAKKSNLFNIMLYFNIIGLVIVIIGYYV